MQYARIDFVWFLIFRRPLHGFTLVELDVATGRRWRLLWKKAVGMWHPWLRLHWARYLEILKALEKSVRFSEGAQSSSTAAVHQFITKFLARCNLLYWMCLYIIYIFKGCRPCRRPRKNWTSIFWSSTLFLWPPTLPFRGACYNSMDIIYIYMYIYMGPIIIHRKRKRPGGHFGRRFGGPGVVNRLDW